MAAVTAAAVLDATVNGSKAKLLDDDGIATGEAKDVEDVPALSIEAEEIISESVCIEPDVAEETLDDDEVLRGNLESSFSERSIYPSGRVQIL